MQAIHDISERPFQGDILRRLELQTIRETIAGKYRIYFAVHENEERIEFFMFGIDREICPI